MADSKSKVEPVAYGIRDRRGFYDFVDQNGKQRHYDDSGSNAVPLYTAEQIAAAVEAEMAKYQGCYVCGGGQRLQSLLARFGSTEERERERDEPRIQPDDAASLGRDARTRGPGLVLTRRRSRLVVDTRPNIQAGQRLARRHGGRMCSTWGDHPRIRSQQRCDLAHQAGGPMTPPNPYEMMQEALEALVDELPRHGCSRRDDLAARLHNAHAALAESRKHTAHIGYCGMGRTGMEFAEDDGSFTPGPESRPAILLVRKPDTDDPHA